MLKHTKWLDRCSNLKLSFVVNLKMNVINTVERVYCTLGYWYKSKLEKITSEKVACYKVFQFVLTWLAHLFHILQVELILFIFFTPLQVFHPKNQKKTIDNGGSKLYSSINLFEILWIVTWIRIRKNLCYVYEEEKKEFTAAVIIKTIFKIWHKNKKSWDLWSCATVCWV